MLNNDGYASIRISQTNFFGAPRIGCSPETGQSLPDISKVAQAYGLQTDVIRDQSNLRDDLRRVLGRGGPLVCDTFVLPDEFRGPRLSSVQRPMDRLSPSRWKICIRSFRARSFSPTC